MAVSASANVSQATKHQTAQPLTRPAPLARTRKGKISCAVDTAKSSTIQMASVHANVPTVTDFQTAKTRSAQRIRRARSVAARSVVCARVTVAASAGMDGAVKLARFPPVLSQRMRNHVRALVAAACVGSAISAHRSASARKDGRVKHAMIHCALAQRQTTELSYAMSRAAVSAKSASLVRLFAVVSARSRLEARTALQLTAKSHAGLDGVHPVKHAVRVVKEYVQDKC